MLRSAIRIAAHQLLDQPPIFHDPVIVALVPEASDQETLATLDDPAAPEPRLFRLLFAMRSRFAEDRLARAAARGARQYVMVGAGLNTFAWRQPDFAKDLRIFAVDHPASLAWTQQRFLGHGLKRPDNLSCVPADLEERQLGRQLAAHGFARGTPAFFSMLGVTQYVSQGAIDGVLELVSSLAKGSEIVLSFSPPDDELAGGDLSAAVNSVARTASLGEPWISRLRSVDLIRRLQRLGFDEVFHLTPELARQRYLTGRHDVAQPPRWEQVMAAVV